MTHGPRRIRHMSHDMQGHSFRWPGLDRTRLGPEAYVPQTHGRQTNSQPDALFCTTQHSVLQAPKHDDSREKNSGPAAFFCLSCPLACFCFGQHCTLSPTGATHSPRPTVFFCFILFRLWRLRLLFELTAAAYGDASKNLSWQVHTTRSAGDALFRLFDQRVTSSGGLDVADKWGAVRWRRKAANQERRLCRSQATQARTGQTMTSLSRFS